MYFLNSSGYSLKHKICSLNEKKIVKKSFCSWYLFVFSICDKKRKVLVSLTSPQHVGDQYKPVYNLDYV